ncbi:MAG: pyridoxal phosphate-dependent aminotransferase family protein [Campylobacterota bacterium]|nr:pyridoxal phosphate-dependent aminotransferase family protein [Campylobacterota bacterium]
MYYEKEIRALKHSGRYRERECFSADIIDLASNDYLGLAHNTSLLELTCKELQKYDNHAPKASMLVNGYHEIHRNFEKALSKANDFEEGVILGSGFNANIALIEALVRKKDVLFIDEKYHASGQLAAANVQGRVIYFKHNDAKVLREALEATQSHRCIIAVEGIYSMDGDLMNPDIFALAKEFDALLIVDEAHSSGVVGEKLMGVYEHFNIAIQANHIKMGTLGKAYGSFGGYILASKHIIDYLINRAKPIIYATAPSLFDTLLSHKALEYILEHHKVLHVKIRKRQKRVKEILGISCDGLIIRIPIGDNLKVKMIQKELLKEGVLVGAIRQPTVEHAIIRLIARLGVDDKIFENILKSLAAH